LAFFAPLREFALMRFLFLIAPRRQERKRLLSSSLFTRKLEYKAENFAAVKELEKVMRDQSEQGVKQLKALVEKILSEEAKPLT
jgi:hypothetical protein